MPSDEAPILSPMVATLPPALIADDWIRKALAGGIFLQFTAIIAYLLYLVISHNGELPPATMNVVLMVLTTESNFMMAVVMYYWGSSSGSTAKSAMLEKK